MNRYFISDKESDILITVATKVFGLKIGDIINMAIKNEFLPMTEPFRTEATFILQCRAENKLDAWKIKQSMTRGIRALGTRPVYDADRLQGFFARYHLHEDTENCTITENDALWESAVEVYELLGKQISTGGIHNNRLQVINQYVENSGNYNNRYDVTILVNGLPLVHVELKRRGVPIKEAFNQINRYQRDSFWAGSGLYEYVQIFVISNGTNTKYYSNTTRDSHIKESAGTTRKSSKKTSNSFESVRSTFSSCCASAISARDLPR